MNIKKFHFLSGLIITVFIGLHLFNHLYSIFGIEKHIELMDSLRRFYRNIFIEVILLCSIFIQIFTGIKLFITNRKTAVTNFDKLHIWTGLYLAIFFIIHLTAVFGGRQFLHLDTNFYFGAAGLNTFPFNLFFIPYYGFAIMSFFGHIASIHYKKMKKDIFGLTPVKQSKAVLVFGLCLTVLIFFGLTNHFKGIEVPAEYNALIGR